MLISVVPETSKQLDGGTRANTEPRHSAEYQLAGIAYQEQDYLQARERLEAAASIQQNVIKFHPATSATLLKLACAELKLGDVDKAQ